MLLPLPQAHLYLDDSISGTKEIMHKVDFAFWDGGKFIVIEIDGDNKPASQVIERDRRFKEAGIEVCHILNSDFERGVECLEVVPFRKGRRKKGVKK